MNIEKAVEIIKQFEGCSLVPYKDQGGVLTIGYGTTYYLDGSRVKEGDMITTEQAEDILRFHVAKIAERVHDLCFPVELNENQFAAVVSFVYNIGVGNFKNSTMLRYIHNTFASSRLVADEFLRWTKVNGVENKGLKNRREAEKALFLKEVE